MREILRTFTPLALLALCLLVWFERWIPGSQGFAEAAGETAVLRIVVGLLCLFVLLLVIERQQLHALLRELMARITQARGGSAAVTPALDATDRRADDTRLRHEAIAILIAALESNDARVRESAAQNLERLTGESFGVDPERWRVFLREQA